MLASDLRRLADPLPASEVEWKPGATTRDKSKGLAMCYISSRAVQNRLDEVCGPADWRNEFMPGPEGGVLCGISVYVERIGPDGATSAEWVTKWDGSESTDIEAVKGGLSGAMKRAAVQWGIGRYLYDLPAQWVKLDDRGRFAETPRIPRQHLPQSSGGGSSNAGQNRGDARPAQRPQPGNRPQNGARPQGRPQPSASAQRTSSSADGSRRPQNGARPANDSGSPQNGRRQNGSSQGQRSASGDGARRDPDPRF